MPAEPAAGADGGGGGAGGAVWLPGAHGQAKRRHHHADLVPRRHPHEDAQTPHHAAHRLLHDHRSVVRRSSLTIL